jgi:hypothetical protein
LGTPVSIPLLLLLLILLLLLLVGACGQRRLLSHTRPAASRGHCLAVAGAAHGAGALEAAKALRPQAELGRGGARPQLRLHGGCRQLVSPQVIHARPPRRGLVAAAKVARTTAAEGRAATAAAVVARRHIVRLALCCAVQLL